MSIQNVSDTARWVAVYRAMESERPDAHFSDPYARRLAGELGEKIVRELPKGMQTAWPMVVRTAVFDEMVMDLVGRGEVDRVVNLAAGLDTRPWRLDLPATLHWVDVDLPGILDYKTEAMRGETPRCRYEAITADLTDAARRDELFAALGGGDARVLVITEGLLIYLEPEEVGRLSAALRAHPGFAWWLTDLASPRLLAMLAKTWGKNLSEGNAPMRFGPAEGSAFFAPFGWCEHVWRDIMEEAHRLRREPRGVWIGRILLRVSTQKRREAFKRLSGFLLLKRC